MYRETRIVTDIHTHKDVEVERDTQAVAYIDSNIRRCWRTEGKTQLLIYRRIYTSADIRRKHTLADIKKGNCLLIYRTTHTFVDTQWDIKIDDIQRDTYSC